MLKAFGAELDLKFIINLNINFIIIIILKPFIVKLKINFNKYNLQIYFGINFE